jgi:hypothetical protein
MIRLTARGCSDNGDFVYRIDLSGREPIVTGNEQDVLMHLRELGVESPELSIAEARQWEEIEIHPQNELSNGSE